jgi:D-arabinose 1-dehydrogenase-like Zn-dependent alcohol dehydrogenase
VLYRKRDGARRLREHGGLGHLGVQFARHMDFHTVAIGRGREKGKLAKDLGAHVYIDTAVDDAAAVLQRRCFLGYCLSCSCRRCLSKCQTRPLRLVNSCSDSY